VVGRRQALAQGHHHCILAIIRQLIEGGVQLVVTWLPVAQRFDEQAT
jgi:hypothetical protein